MKLTIEETVKKAYNVDTDEVLEFLEQAITFAKKYNAHVVQVDCELLKTSATVIRELVKRNSKECQCRDSFPQDDFENMRNYFATFLGRSYR